MVLICCFITAHRSIAEIPLQRGSLRSFKTQSALSFFFLSAERAERKKQQPFGISSLIIEYSDLYIHCRLAIIDPPEADCFSFAVACIPC
jgi:hypothetical protein